MISIFVTCVAMFLAGLFIVGSSALVAIVLEIDDPLMWLYTFWGAMFAITFTIVKLCTWIARYAVAAAVVRLGTVCAVLMLASGILMVGAKVLGLSPWMALPIAVGFGVLLMVRDDEIRVHLLLPKRPPHPSRLLPDRPDTQPPSTRQR